MYTIELTVYVIMFLFFVMQKTAYEMRISDWSADVCASDLVQHDTGGFLAILAEELFEHVHDELHGSVVVIQHQNLVHRRLLRLRLAFDDDPRRSAAAAPLVFTHRSASDPTPSPEDRKSTRLNSSH